MTSNAGLFGTIDEGMFKGNYDIRGKSGKLKSHWVLNHRGPVRMMDGKINPNAKDQIMGVEGYKNHIFIHSSNKDGFAGGTVSIECLLIAPSDWQGFNRVMSGVANFKVQVTCQTQVLAPLQGVTGPTDIYYIKNILKYD